MILYVVCEIINLCSLFIYLFFIFLVCCIYNLFSYVLNINIEELDYHKVIIFNYFLYQLFLFLYFYVSPIPIFILRSYLQTGINYLNKSLNQVLVLQCQDTF